MSKSNVHASHSILIDADVMMVWDLLAVRFGDIYLWASGVTHSSGHGQPVNGSVCSERACEISAMGFSDTKERITVFDPTNFVLTYTLYDGLPGFVEDANNTWTLEQRGSQTFVKASTSMYAKGIMGLLMKRFMQASTKKALRHMCEELKHYLEQGEVHPRKAKAIAKSIKRN